MLWLGGGPGGSTSAAPHGGGRGEEEGGGGGGGDLVVAAPAEANGAATKYCSLPEFRCCGWGRVIDDGY